MAPVRAIEENGEELLVALGRAAGARERDDVGMAVELSVLPGGVPAPEDFEIERVMDEEGLSAWEDALGRGFGEGPREAVWVAQMYRRMGFGDDVPWRHYLGRLCGEPVATSTLFPGAGAAGIYFVSTVEERSGVIRDGLSGLPPARVRGLLQDRPLRVATIG